MGFKDTMKDRMGAQDTLLALIKMGQETDRTGLADRCERLEEEVQRTRRFLHALRNWVPLVADHLTIPFNAASE